jgi:hypothetical protein
MRERLAIVGMIALVAGVVGVFADTAWANAALIAGALLVLGPDIWDRLFRRGRSAGPADDE